MKHMLTQRAVITDILSCIYWELVDVNDTYKHKCSSFEFCIILSDEYGKYSLSSCICSLMFCCISVVIRQMSHELQVVDSSKWAEEISTHL